MIIEFYRHGSLLPENYDAVVDASGRIKLVNNLGPNEGIKRYIVHSKHNYMPSVVGGPLFRLLMAHPIVTVIFYGFNE